MGAIRRLYDLARLNFVLFPGIWEPRAAAFLQPYYRHLRSQGGALFLAKNALIYLGFMAYVPIRARRVAAKWGLDTEWVAKASKWGREHFVDPNDIASFRIEDPAEFEWYQRRFEQVLVVRAIEREDTDHNALMLDKAAFQSHCEKLGLAVPRIFATIVDGTTNIHCEPPEATQVIFKPARGSGGHGISTAEVTSQAEFRAQLDNLDEGAWVVQEKCTVHPDIADLALDALPTARIVTILDEGGDPEIVTCAVRFATHRGVPVDNVHRGGLAALIDLETGVLSDPMEMEGPGLFDRHPTTGTQIAGRVMPDWDAARLLTLRAHREAFGSQVIIGWDIGFTNRGPVLIEANQRPNVRLTQRVERKGIGAMRYGELIEHHLARAIAEGPFARRRILTES